MLAMTAEVLIQLLIYIIPSDFSLMSLLIMKRFSELRKGREASKF